MKIVVTGGTGFLGFQLVERLKALSHEVTVVSRSSGHDIRDPATLVDPFSGADLVFHLAALVQSRPGAFDEVNIDGLKNVLEASHRAGAKRFVYVSSFTIFGPSGARPHREEDVPERAHFFHGYDRTKYEGYRLAQRWKQRIPMNTVFPAVIYGPGRLTEGNILVRMFQRWAKTRVAPLPLGGRPRWNFVHVEDVVSGLCGVWQRGAPGSDYILGGADVKLNDLWQTFQKVARKRILRISVPARIFRLSAYGEDWMSRMLRVPPLVTPTTSEFFMNDWMFSSQRAKSDLDYQPRTLEAGLRDTYQWMRREALL